MKVWPARQMPQVFRMWPSVSLFFWGGQTATSESVINLTGMDVDINIIDLSGIMASDPSIGEDEAVMDEDSDSEIEIVDI
jgi:hypothetical protein